MYFVIDSFLDSLNQFAYNCENYHLKVDDIQAI